MVQIEAFCDTVWFGFILGYSILFVALKDIFHPFFHLHNLQNKPAFPSLTNPQLSLPNSSETQAIPFPGFLRGYFEEQFNLSVLCIETFGFTGMSALRPERDKNSPETQKLFQFKLFHLLLPTPFTSQNPGHIVILISHKGMPPALSGLVEMFHVILKHWFSCSVLRPWNESPLKFIIKFNSANTFLGSACALACEEWKGSLCRCLHACVASGTS